MMLNYIIPIVALRSCKPLLKQHLSTNIDKNNFILLNTCLCFIFSGLYLFYLYMTDKYDPSSCGNISCFQLLIACIIAFITVFSGIIYSKLSSEGNISILLPQIKIISTIIIIMSGVLFLGEKITNIQIIGILLLFIGLFLVGKSYD